ncbi:MAG: ATP phosphoribosyltransferase regulatory subunit [Halothiobacillaceae bacterium]|nr:MAG: ATP phosphoribosyltransferase regulatory subunit [Halothiobacillaceae bacterium]
MTQENRWLLPAGIDELLPDAAWATEELRRRLLDRFRAWGYELVIPPMVEFVESLLIHPGDDLDLSTFKLIDQLTGRLMGIRADMTPQMARIDAHSLRHEGVTRLCYLGTVLHTTPGGFAGSRAPMQVGAELFGHAGIASDIEILQLMRDVLEAAGVRDFLLDLGHVGIFRALAVQAGFGPEDEAVFFDLLQRKAIPDIEAFVTKRGLNPHLADMLKALADLHGEGVEVLRRARKVLAHAGADVGKALDDLSVVAQALAAGSEHVRLHFDLSELRGYHYHTGIVFAAFVPGQGQAIARGGRYDGIGEAFGRARPATGFSADVRALVELCPRDVVKDSAVLAPAISADADLLRAVRELRAQGQRIIHSLPGQGPDPVSQGCSRVLQKHDGFWQVREI